MMALFGSLGFLSPWLLLIGVPVLGLLVTAYRRKGTGRSVAIPTLLLLRDFKATVSKPKRFVPPPRFFLELLIALLLIGWASGLAMSRPHPRLALVFDNSASMQAALTGGFNVFAQGQKDARVFLGSLSIDSEVQVFVTTPRLEMKSAGFVSASEAKGVVADIAPVQGGDNLGVAVQRLLESVEFDRVVAITDKTLARQEMQGEFGGIPINSRLAIRSVSPDGFRVGNLAVAEISIREDNATASVDVTAASFDKEPRKLSIHLDQAADFGGKIVVDAAGDRELELAPGQRKTVSFEISTDRLVGVHAKIIQSLENPPRKDAIAFDDEMFASFNPPRQKVLIITPSDPKSLQLDRLREFQFDVQPPEWLDGRSNDELAAAYQLAIFHRVTPPPQLRVPRLVILPPNAEGSNIVEGPYERENITSWDASHPLTSYLQFGGVELRNGLILSVPEGSRRIVNVTRGAVVTARDLKAERSVTVGFELFPFEGKRALFASVVLLNSMKWLRGGEVLGETIPLNVAQEGITLVKRVDRSEQSGFISTANGVTFTESGLYAIDGVSGKQLISTGFFSIEESTTLAPPEVVAAIVERRDTPHVEPMTFDRFFSWVLGALLALDFVLFGIVEFRRRVRTAPTSAA